MSVTIGPASRYNKQAFPTASALQKVLDGGQKEIVLAEGVYTIAAALNIPAGVSVRGAGPTSTIIEYDSPRSISSLFTLNADSSLSDLGIKRVGSGSVLYGALLSGSQARIKNLALRLCSIRLTGSLCRAQECTVNDAPNGIIVEGTNGQVICNVINSCVRGIYLDGGTVNHISGNLIVGAVSSSRGVHIVNGADFNHISDNIIRDIRAASPGRGIDLESTGGANIFIGNIFSGTFGANAIVVSAGVPNTCQFLNNITHAVAPASARLSSGDLGDATGFANT